MTVVSLVILQVVSDVGVGPVVVVSVVQEVDEDVLVDDVVDELLEVLPVVHDLVLPVVHDLVVPVVHDVVDDVDDDVVVSSPLSRPQNLLLLLFPPWPT